MTYMSGFDGEYAIECQYYDGLGSDTNFIKNENVYFLGQIKVSQNSAAHLGYPGYFKINESPVAIVSRFDSTNNVIYLVSNAQNLANFRNRGICYGDIVVGAKSGATRKIGVNFSIYNDSGQSVLKTGIKELGYVPNFHDLLNFNVDDRSMYYDRVKPFNEGFFAGSIFNNLDNKFSCLSVSDRFELPVPYTANSFGFNLFTAVTPRHVFMSAHVAAFSGNSCQFYDPSSNSIITKVISKKLILNPSLFGDLIKNEDNNGRSIQIGDVAICLLDSPLPDSIRPAFVPDVSERNENDSFIRRMDSLLIDQTRRGYYMNAFKGGRSMPVTSGPSIESCDFGIVNSSRFLTDIIDYSSAPLFGGVGDSNSMIFTCIENSLIFLGSVVFVNQESAGLDGRYIGENQYSILDLYFPWYLNKDGNIINSPKDRYRDKHFWLSNGSFWFSIGNSALRHIFTSQEVWGESIDPSFVPSRIKVMNDINIVEPAVVVNTPGSNIIGNKIKFVSR